MTAAEGDVAVLAELWREWAALGNEMAATDWTLPTRLERWTVVELYAHASGWVLALERFLGRVTTEPPTHGEGLEVLHSLPLVGPEREALNVEVARMSAEDAASHSPDELVERFAVRGPRALERAGEQLTATVRFFQGQRARLGDCLPIAVIEATVHLTDLQHALGREPEVPAGALARATDLLATLASSVAFLEQATGRTRQSVFPVYI